MEVLLIVHELSLDRNCCSNRKRESRGMRYCKELFIDRRNYEYIRPEQSGNKRKATQTFIGRSQQYKAIGHGEKNRAFPWTNFQNYEFLGLMRLPVSGPGVFHKTFGAKKQMSSMISKTAYLVSRQVSKYLTFYGSEKQYTIEFSLKVANGSQKKVEPVVGLIFGQGDLALHFVLKKCCFSQFF